jgi:hypothetical protein
VNVKNEGLSGALERTPLPIQKREDTSEPLTMKLTDSAEPGTQKGLHCAGGKTTPSAKPLAEKPEPLSSKPTRVPKTAGTRDTAPLVTAAACTATGQKHVVANPTHSPDNLIFFTNPLWNYPGV